MSSQHRYIATRRVTYADLTGYRWKYVAIPRSLAHNGAGIPISDYEHGEIITDRFVLQSHLEKAGLRRWTTNDSIDVQAQRASWPRRKTMTNCEMCAVSYSEYGDGWDGLCPSCADKVSAYMDDHHVDRDTAIIEMTVPPRSSKVETREDRCRRMVADPTTWPGGRLCMKRIEGGRILDGQFGVIYETGLPIVIVCHAGEGTDSWTYPTVDTLVEAGWVID